MKKTEILEKIKTEMLENEENKNDDFAAWESQIDEDIFSCSQDEWEERADKFIDVHFTKW